MKKKKPARKVRVAKPKAQRASERRTHRQKNANFAAAYGAGPDRIAEILKKEPPFKSDYRKQNPGLHRLYVEWAVQHLALLDQIISALGSASNLNLLDSTWAVIHERAKLIRTNAAYAEAEKLINIYKSVHPFKIDRTVQYNVALDQN